MHKHILLAVDGTTLSRKAVRESFDLARATGARVTAFHATPEYESLHYGEYFPMDRMTREDFEERARAHAGKLLAAVTRAAEAAGVTCGVHVAPSRTVWEGIVEAARRKRCDLIVMASHGRRGIAGVLLGSETSRVLTHSRVPVLVCR